MAFLIIMIMSGISQAAGILFAQFAAKVILKALRVSLISPCSQGLLSLQSL